MGKQRKIIFMTNSEYGQANVHLAVIYEMLLLQQFQIHVASFEPLQDRIKSLNEFVPNNHSPATFHALPHHSSLDDVDERFGFVGPFEPGVRGALDTYRITLPAMITAWDGQIYMEIYQICLDLLRTVNPDLIVVDPLFAQGIEACKTLSRNYVVLSPNTFLEVCRSQQPVYAAFCKFPAISSGFKYPVPWSRIPANIFLKFAILWYLLTNPLVRALMSFRKTQKLPAIPPFFKIYAKENQYLVPSIPQSDFPCYIPSNVTGCGPILLPVSPVSKDDPSLLAWLAQAPTILVNMGTLVRMSDTMARQFAAGLKIVLDRNPKLQVLWKLKMKGGLVMGVKDKTGKGQKEEGVTMESLQILAAEMSSDRVRVEKWLSVEPHAILETGHIACLIHHGGSNSFHEALSAGVPQVVIPCWLDTLDFARRVEFLGLGVYGSETSTPSVEAQELARGLSRVVGDGPEAVRIRQKAKELADVSGRLGGRKRACDKIIDILERS